MFLWGKGNDMSATTATSSAGFTDWGTYPISNGGETGGLWHTLTYNEWHYLFLYSRGNTGDPFGRGTVNGINGVILLPNSFVKPAGINITAHQYNESWNTNVYTLEEWAAMEEAGAVFLPAAGYYNATNIVQEQERGCYWSTSRVNRGIAQFAFFTHNDGFFYPLDWRRKYPTTLTFSCSVRLVCEQQSAE